MIYGLSLTGGVTALATKLRPEMFGWDAVGWSQIGAWMIAGIGSIFATQHVIQALYTVPNVRAAQKACFYCAAAMVPFGILTAAVGMASAALHPGINPLQIGRASCREGVCRYV